MGISCNSVNCLNFHCGVRRLERRTSKERSFHHWRSFHPAPASLSLPAAGMGTSCSASGNSSRCNSIWTWKMFRWYPSTASVSDDEPVPDCPRTAQWSWVWLPARRICSRLFLPAVDSGQPCTGACACEAAADGGVEMRTKPLTLAGYEAEADSDVEL